MRYASATIDGRPVLVEVRGDLAVPLRGLSELGRETTPEALAGADRLDRSAVPIDALRLRPVVPSPSKVVCVGLNYRSHLEETARDANDYPVLFTKFASSLTGAGERILVPAESEQVDYEGELAVIIGLPGRRIPEERALEHVLGYSIANDVTMRDFQYRTHQWLQGKAWDASTPLGPTMVTPDEVDLSRARIRTVLNGDVVQDSDLSRLIFPIPRLIAAISEFTGLVPGDVILTGTPGGVGYRRAPQLFLHDGDVITVAIDGVGELRSEVAAEVPAID